MPSLCCSLRFVLEFTEKGGGRALPFAFFRWEFMGGCETCPPHVDDLVQYQCTACKIDVCRHCLPRVTRKCVVLKINLDEYEAFCLLPDHAYMHLCATVSIYARPPVWFACTLTWFRHNQGTSWIYVRTGDSMHSSPSPHTYWHHQRLLPDIVCATRSHPSVAYQSRHRTQQVQVCRLRGSNRVSRHVF